MILDMAGCSLWKRSPVEFTLLYPSSTVVMAKAVDTKYLGFGYACSCRLEVIIEELWLVG